MLKIAIIEDNAALRDSIAEHLCAEGYRVGSFSCVEHFTASDFAPEARILILDLNLPGEDGVSFAVALRAQGSTVGIIMLTARSEIHQRALGYSSGADIYLTKPSSPEELSAAVASLASRLSDDAGRGRVLTLSRQRMTLDGPAGSTDLTAAEADMLDAFAAAGQGRLSTESLLGICRLTPSDSESKKLIEVRITRLRRKLESCDADARIRAIRGWGYQLSARLAIKE